MLQKLWQWLFSRSKPTAAPVAKAVAKAPAETRGTEPTAAPVAKAPAEIHSKEPGAAAQRRTDAEAGADLEKPEGLDFPNEKPGALHLDEPIQGSLAERQEQILAKIRQRIEAGSYELPHLPSTSMAILDMASDPMADVKRISDGIAGDPVLASELLKTANSVLYHCPQPAETVHQAIVRLGLRNLRALILSLSMKNVISKSRGLMDYASEVWRQSISVAKIARVLSKPARIDADKAFLIGLLHDIGKVALLDLLGKVITSRMDLTRALVGRVFLDMHERVGEAMAKQWKLPEEVAAVAACHHDYLKNETHPKAAALASLCHKIDLYLRMGSETEYWRLRLGDEVKALGLDADSVTPALKECLRLYQQSSQPAPVMAGSA